MIFDGAFEEFPLLSGGFLEAVVDGLPDLAHAYHEHLLGKDELGTLFKSTYRPSLMRFNKLR
jgi:hypothetical protein